MCRCKAYSGACKKGDRSVTAAEEEVKKGYVKEELRIPANKQLISWAVGHTSPFRGFIKLASVDSPPLQFFVFGVDDDPNDDLIIN